MQEVIKNTDDEALLKQLTRRACRALNNVLSLETAVEKFRKGNIGGFLSVWQSWSKNGLSENYLRTLMEGLTSWTKMASYEIRAIKDLEPYKAPRRH